MFVRVLCKSPICLVFIPAFRRWSIWLYNKSIEHHKRLDSCADWFDNVIYERWNRFNQKGHLTEIPRKHKSVCVHMNSAIVCCTKAQLTKESQARIKTIIGARRKLNTPMGFLCVCGEALYCSKACSKKYWKKVANPCPCKVKSNWFCKEHCILMIAIGSSLSPNQKASGIFGLVLSWCESPNELFQFLVFIYALRH